MAEARQIQARIPSVMEDPQQSSIARVYANALLDACPEEQRASLIEELESFVKDILPQHPEFRRLLNSAIVARDDKLRMIANVVTGRATPIFANFLKVLARHDRLDLLPAICRQLRLQHEIRSGRRRVQVTTAVAISEGARLAIEQGLAQVLPYQPIVELSVDSSLVAGLRIRVGDTVYDGSLRARLKQLQHRVQQRSTHEIQSGRDRFSHPAGD